MSKDTSFHESKTQGAEEGWRPLRKNRVMFPRGPEEWLGRICLTPLAKERQHVVMWPPSKMKVFSSKLKTGQKKKQCHTLNLDSFGYSHCSLCMQQIDWECLALLQPHGEMGCIMSFRISCCRICLSPLGQSHSTAYTLWHSKECSLPGTVLGTHFA